MKDLLSWPLVIAAVVVYFIGLAVYRLILHPLSRFPGPKLAALTRYYEAYFDLIRNGQYTFKIAELHKRYGRTAKLPLLSVRNFSLTSTKVPLSASVLMSYTSAILSSLTRSTAKMQVTTSMTGLSTPSHLEGRQSPRRLITSTELAVNR